MGGCSVDHLLYLSEADGEKRACFAECADGSVSRPSLTSIAQALAEETGIGAAP